MCRWSESEIVLLNLVELKYVIFDWLDLQEMEFVTLDVDAFLKLFEDNNATTTTEPDKESNTKESQLPMEPDEGAPCQPAFFEEPHCTMATFNPSTLLNQNTIHEAPLPYHEAIKLQQVESRECLNIQCRIFKC